MDKELNNDETPEYLDKLNEYFKLKNDYQMNYEAKKNKIFKNDLLSMKQKKEQFKKIKMKCIQCKRNVGTIFSIKTVMDDDPEYEDKSFYSTLSAVCGDKINPCDLNISIQKGNYESFKYIISIFQENVKDYQEEIIKVKLDLLFNFTEEVDAMKKYEEIKSELMNDLENLANYKMIYVNIISNLNNAAEIEKKTTQLNNNINTIKETIDEYNETNNIQLIKDIITLYKNTLTPLLDDLQKLKYKYRSMEKMDNIYKLIRKEYNIADTLEQIEEPKVISFNYNGGKRENLNTLTIENITLS